MKMGLALGIAAVAFVNLVTPASADPLDDVIAVSRTVDTFYCYSEKGSRIMVFAHEGSENGNLLMFPEGTAARRNGDVFTSDLPDGTMSLNSEQLVTLTGDGVETATCKPFDDEMINFLMALSAANPELLAGAAQGAALAEKQFRIDGLKTQLEFLNGDLKASRSELANLKIERNDANPFKDDMDRLKRENDKLKRRICAMDPKATFTVCQP